MTPQSWPTSRLRFPDDRTSERPRAWLSERRHEHRRDTVTSLAITGATGQLGGLVAAHLADERPRLIVRDIDRAPDGYEKVVATYGDADAARAALAGIDVLFMVSGSESLDRRAEHRTFVSAAAEAGVRHIVYTSIVGASHDSVFTLGRDHADTEIAIHESGMSFTILRDNFYLELLPFFADAGGVIRGPAADGRVAGVSRRDVADVAAAVLREPQRHSGSTYELTGPEALTLDALAARAGTVLGRELSYHPETVDEAYASRRPLSSEQWKLDQWVSTYTAFAAGEFERVTDDVRAVAGHAPRSLEEALRA